MEDIRSDNRTTIEVVEAVVREIAGKVDALRGIEKRVAGLERRTG